MTFSFQRGRYDARFAQSQIDLELCYALRHQCFRGRPGRDFEPLDSDCQHLMIFDAGVLVATCRLLIMHSSLAGSYAAQRYDLAPLQGRGPFLEVGRFCIAQSYHQGDILRLAWGMITRLVDQEGVQTLLGCVSFDGTLASKHSAEFDLLARKYQPKCGAPITAHSNTKVVLKRDSKRSGPASLPPLLRSYLSLGGTVSSEAVIDDDLGTIHVLCVVELKNIPPQRARTLRAIAQ